MVEKAAAPETDAQATELPAGQPGHRPSGAGPVESGAILFPLLVLAHYRHFMLNARYGSPGGIPVRYAPEESAGGADGDSGRRPSREARDDARRAYERVLRKFQAGEGTIRSAYWCVYAPSAVALTVKHRTPWRRFPGVRISRDPIIRLHSATDWLTSAYPEITVLQHHTDTLAIKAAEVLRGTAKLITLQWLFEEHRFLLASAEERARRGSNATADGRDAAAPVAQGDARGDERSNGGDVPPATSVLPATGVAVSLAAPLPQIIKHARNELLEIERYYDRAANKAARIVYLWGMLAGTFVALALVALMALIVDKSFVDIDRGDADVRNFFVCYAAGALGAVVSVLMRMKSEDGFTLDYEVGRAQSFRLGSFRPFIGATFGLVIFFAIKSGLLQIGVPDAGTDDLFFFLALLAFLAGFSERLTKIVLGRAERTIAATFEGDDSAESTPSPPTPPTPADETLRRLERWAQLREQGVLTEEELQAQKRLELGG
jgi:hypothetical protein